MLVFFSILLSLFLSICKFVGWARVCTRIIKRNVDKKKTTNVCIKPLRSGLDHNQKFLCHLTKRKVTTVTTTFRILLTFLFNLATWSLWPRRLTFVRRYTFYTTLRHNGGSMPLMGRFISPFGFWIVLAYRRLPFFSNNFNKEVNLTVSNHMLWSTNSHRQHVRYHGQWICRTKEQLSRWLYAKGHRAAETTCYPDLSTQAVKCLITAHDIEHYSEPLPDRAYFRKISSLCHGQTINRTKHSLLKKYIGFQPKYFNSAYSRIHWGEHLRH